MLGTKVGPFNLRELGKALPPVEQGAQGQVSPIPLSLTHLHAAGTWASPTVLLSIALAPLRDKELTPLHYLWDEARSSGRTQTDPY